jgi:superfamily II DNA or RNA helicase
MKKIKAVIEGGIIIKEEYTLYASLGRYIYNSRNGTVYNFQTFETEDGAFVRYPRNKNKFIQSGDFYEEVEFEFIDNRFSSEPIDFELSKNFKLRDYQVKPVKKILAQLRTSDMNSALLQAEPGFGKTYILPAIVKNLKQKTLVLVDRNLLRDQMFEEFTKNSEANVTVLENDTMEFGDVVITTFQMLLHNQNLLEKLKKEIGLVIVDECHIAPAKEFSNIIHQFPAKYRLGLSATPTRSDGLTSIIYDTFGYTKVIGDNPNSLKVYNIVVNTEIPIYFRNKSEYAKKFVEALTTPLLTSKDNQTAIELAVETAIALKAKGRKAFIYLTYSKLHTLTKNLLEAAGYSVGVISSKTSAVKRDKMMEDFQSGKLDFLVSGVILQKGVSIHALDTIINLSPQNKEGLEQTVGRLRREHSDKKTPMFIYFTFAGKMIYTNENKVDVLKRMSNKGDKFARLSVKQFREKIK